jgi:hypothetical protein
MIHHLQFTPPHQSSEELRRELIEEPNFSLEFPLIKELNECDEYTQQIYHDSQILKVEL